MRGPICSLLPSATEIAFVLGLDNRLVGVTHECDFLAAARRLPVVTRTIMGHEVRDSRDIHRHIATALHEGSSLYLFDQGLLAPPLVNMDGLRPRFPALGPVPVTSAPSPARWSHAGARRHSEASSALIRPVHSPVDGGGVPSWHAAQPGGARSAREERPGCALWRRLLGGQCLRKRASINNIDNLIPFVWVE